LQEKGGHQILDKRKTTNGIKLKNAKRKVEHGIQLVFNKDKLDVVMEDYTPSWLSKTGATSGKYKYINLYEDLMRMFPLDLKYNSFWSLLQNRSSWGILYAYCIAEFFNKDILYFFDLKPCEVSEDSAAI
jgi:hypothetical protein